MTSRERLIKAINHEQPDRVPVDLGATPQTGINASPLYQLRRALKLEQRPIRVVEPLQILGEVEPDVIRTIGVDVVGLFNPVNAFGIRNEKWKPWSMPDGTPTLMAGGFEYDVKDDGAIYAYPQGDRECGYSLQLPKEGYFFDAVDRFGEVDEARLNAKADFGNDFGLFHDETARYLEERSKSLYEYTDLGVVGNFGGAGFGDMGSLPGYFLKEVKGVRRMEDWLMAHILWPDYVHEVFDLQMEAALQNLEIYRQAVGDRIQVVTVSGTDFGTQNAEMISPDIFRRFYKPRYKKVNDWIHANTAWKTFFHTCGSIVNLLDDLSEAGVDILNPVQCSAAGMDPRMLKEKYGSRFVFWGGGVDTQQTLPFGKPDKVKKEVEERMEIFSPGGGFVFAAIHNVVGKTPVENLLAMLDTIRTHR